MSPRGQRLLRSVRATGNLSPAVSIGIPSTLLVLVGGVDWLGGPTLNLFLWYAVVVVGAAWTGRRWFAVVAAGFTVSASALVQVAHPDAVASDTVVVANMVFRSGLLALLIVGTLTLRTTILDLDRLARVDLLTGLLNRRAFLEVAEREWRRLRRDAGPLCVAYLDLDGLKRLNDEVGHEAGDELIRRFAACLQDTLRATDLAGRLGGDEFAVVLPDTDRVGAAALVERLRSIEGVPSFSCGIVVADSDRRSLRELLAASDALMYQAKTGTLGTVVEALADS